jgi:hypothetical protein
VRIFEEEAMQTISSKSNQKITNMNDSTSKSFEWSDGKMTPRDCHSPQRSLDCDRMQQKSQRYLQAPVKASHSQDSDFGFTLENKYSEIAEVRKLNLDDDDQFIEEESYETPRGYEKTKKPMNSSCYQDSTVYTQKQKDFAKISASKFLFKDD